MAKCCSNDGHPRGVVKSRRLEWLFSTVKQYVEAGVGSYNTVTIPLVTAKKTVVSRGLRRFEYS